MTIPIPPDEALKGMFHSTPLFIDSLRAVATLAAKQAAEQAVKEAGIEVEKFLRDWFYHDVHRDIRETLLRRIKLNLPHIFTPTPPKEQQPVTSDPVFGPREPPTLSLVQQVNGLRQQLDESREIVKRLSQELADTKRDCPSPDPATVRPDEATVMAVIDFLKGDGFAWAAAAEAHIAAKFLTKPTPAPEPERYVTPDEVATILFEECGVSPGVCERAVERLRPLAAKRGPMLTAEQAFGAAICELGTLDKDNSHGLLAAIRLAAKQGGTSLDTTRS